MEKYEMRDWVASLEEMIAKKLKTWDRHKKWENGRVVHLMWQWEQTLVKVDIFWHDKEESVRLRYIGHSKYIDLTFPGLVNKTYREVEHYVAHWAMSLAHPPIDPMDNLGTSEGIA